MVVANLAQRAPRGTGPAGTHEVGDGGRKLSRLRCIDASARALLVPHLRVLWHGHGALAPSPSSIDSGP